MICIFTSGVFAHNASITRIDVKVEAQSLVVTLGLNQSDLMEHVLNVVHGPGHFADRQEYEDAAPKVQQYVVQHLRLSADGKPLAASLVPPWPVQHVELTHLDAMGLEVESVIPLMLRYSLPDGTKSVQLQPQLFVAANFAASFIVTVYRGGGAGPVTAVIDRHEPVTFELKMPPGPSTNSAQLQRTDDARRAVMEPGSGFVSTGVVILSTIAILICIAVWLWLRKSGESGKKCDDNY